MLGNKAADQSPTEVLDPSRLYGAGGLQSPAVRGQGWQALPQDPETDLRRATNVTNIPPVMIARQAAPLNPQTGLGSKMRSRYTFLPVGGAARAPQSSA